VKTIAANAFLSVAARNGKQSGDGRQIAMESSIEASHLSDVGMSARDSFDQRDFGRQVFGIVRLEPFEVFDQFRSHNLRFQVIGPAANNAVPNRADAGILGQVFEDFFDRSLRIVREQGPVLKDAGMIFHLEFRARSAKAIHFAPRQSAGWIRR
jgi:hypothetical protein